MVLNDDVSDFYFALKRMVDTVYVYRIFTEIVVRTNS